jgi:uncharacterized RDD family membrane protein YckC
VSATYDPFLAPASDLGAVDEDFVPATLGDRFIARIVDNLAGAATIVPGGVAMALVGGPEAMEQDVGSMVIGVVGILATVGLMLGLVVLQCVWLTTRGQSVGKRAVGIHIAKVDGRPVDFVSAVVLRTWLPSLVIGVANQLCLGWLVSLVDIAPIFGQDRRSVHDYVAGTRVGAGLPAHLYVDDV